MADLAFADMLACQIGDTIYALDSYTVREEPIIVQDIGRTGTSVTLRATGRIEADDADGFADAVLAAVTSSRLSGSAVVITGLGGGIEYQLLPASCIEGGPHVAIDVDQQSEVFSKPVTFEVTAKTSGDSNGDISGTGYTETVSTRPDGLRSVERDGHINGTSVTVSDALDAFKATYPPAKWVIQYKSSSDNRGQNVTYTITADELAHPFDYLDAGDTVVDGEATIRTDRDEQHRLTSTYEFDLLISGTDYLSVVDQLRTGATQQQADSGSSQDDDDDAGVIVRESVEVSVLKETHLRASFSFLSGADGNKLLNWTQTIEFADGSQDIYQQQTYLGTDPVLIQQPSAYGRVVQSGQATGAGDFPKEPQPIIDDAFLEPPRVVLTAVNTREFQTAWNYVMAADDDFDLSDHTDDLVRPDSPSFYGDS